MWKVVNDQTNYEVYDSETYAEAKDCAELLNGLDHNWGYTYSVRKD